MRWRFPSVLTAAEAKSLASVEEYKGFDAVAVAPVVGLIGSVADVTLAAPSYCRVEGRREGHPWHCDTGSQGLMAWCRVSASVLLTPPDEFTGGGFYFRDAPEEPVFHYRDCLVYDDAPENEHCIAANSGGRRALIMFFAHA